MHWEEAEEEEVRTRDQWSQKSPRGREVVEEREEEEVELWEGRGGESKTRRQAQRRRMGMMKDSTASLPLAVWETVHHDERASMASQRTGLLL